MEAVQWLVDRRKIITALRSADDSHFDDAPARVDIVVDQHHLLPGAKQKPAVTDRHDDRRSQQRRLHVTMAVTIMPSHLVSVCRVLRGQLLDSPLKVFDRSRLVFDGRQ